MRKPNIQSFLTFLLLCILPIRLFFSLYNVIYTFKRHASLTHIRENSSKSANRPYQRRIIGSKCHKFSHCNIAINRLYSANHNHRHHLKPGNQISHAPIETGKCSKLNPQLRKCVIFLLKSLHLKLFSSKCPHYPNSGSIFLHYGRQFSFRLIGIRKPPCNQAIKNSRI